MPNSKDAVMMRLLDACVTVLKKQGMSQLFLDGVKGGYDGFLSLGEPKNDPQLFFYSSRSLPST